MQALKKMGINTTVSNVLSQGFLFDGHLSYLSDRLAFMRGDISDKVNNFFSLPVIYSSSMMSQGKSIH